MKRIVQGCLMVALIATLAACQPVEQQEGDAATGIAEVRDRFVEAYNRHDAAAVAELYTSDAVFVNPRGREISGRDQIRQELEGFFRDARPQLTASATATEGAERLGWEMGTYQLQLQPTAQPQLGQPPTLGTEPRVGEPAATTQPGQPATAQPGTPAQPGQPPLGAQARSEQGHYLLVVEQEADAWLIRAHVAHAGSPTAAMMPPQQPVTTPTTLGPPTQPPAATTPAPGEPARTQPRPREPAPPATTTEPAEEPEGQEDDLEPPPEEDDTPPGR